MLSANQWLFIFLLQLIVVLGVLLAVSLFKLNRLKKAATVSGAAGHSVGHEGSDLRAYLQTEIDRTQQRMGHLKKNAASKDSSGLNLRIQLLKFELAYLAMFGGSDKSEDTINWDDVNLRVYRILKECGFYRDKDHLVRSLGNHSAESLPSESLIEQQNKTIEHLKSFIKDLLSQMDPQALPNDDLDGHFNELEQAKIELEQCVIILEDENGFLRDQIAALLKLQKSDELEE